MKSFVLPFAAKTKRSDQLMTPLTPPTPASELDKHPPVSTSQPWLGYGWSNIFQWLVFCFKQAVDNVNPGLINHCTPPK